MHLNWLGARLETKQEITISTKPYISANWARSCPKKYHKLLRTPPLSARVGEKPDAAPIWYTHKSPFFTYVCVRARWWIILLFELMNAVSGRKWRFAGCLCVKSKTLHAQNVSRAWFTRGVINSETSTPAREHYHNSAWFTPARSDNPQTDTPRQHTHILQYSNARALDFNKESVTSRAVWSIKLNALWR